MRTSTGRRWTPKTAALGAVIAFVLSLATLPATADHNKGTYRPNSDPWSSHGYLWFATFDNNAIAWVSSDRCYPREADAWARVKSSTTDASYLRAKWPSGIRIHTERCDGVVDRYIDIRLDYQDDFLSTHGNYGGQNHSVPAARSWCDIWNRAYPCGYHVSTVHLNDTRFGNDNYSFAYRERLLMHETGHSLGLAHHCSTNSIMNDGTSGCNGGAWTNVMGYLATDRQGINQTYPGWIYQ